MKGKLRTVESDESWLHKSDEGAGEEKHEARPQHHQQVLRVDGIGDAWYLSTKYLVSLRPNPEVETAVQLLTSRVLD